MKTIINFALLAGLISASSHASSLPEDRHQQPPFSEFECESTWGPLSFFINRNGRPGENGSAHIQGVRVHWKGGWSWSQAPEATRLSGHYILKVHGSQWHSGGRPLDFSAYYNPTFGNLTLEQLQIGEVTESVKCEIVP